MRFIQVRKVVFRWRLWFHRRVPIWITEYGEQTKPEYALGVTYAKQAADAKTALIHARHCVAICEKNDADAFERFFGEGVRALALRALGEDREFAQARAAALAHHDTLPAEQKSWCEAMLASIA